MANRGGGNYPADYYSTRDLVQSGMRPAQEITTPDWIKHFYIHSADRDNINPDISSNALITLGTTIETPPDGTTYLKVVKTAVPFTFRNVYNELNFCVAMRFLGNVISLLPIRIPAGRYTFSELIQTINETIANTIGNMNAYALQNPAPVLYARISNKANVPANWVNDPVWTYPGHPQANQNPYRLTFFCNKVFEVSVRDTAAVGGLARVPNPTFAFSQEIMGMDGYETVGSQAGIAADDFAAGAIANFTVSAVNQANQCVNCAYMPGMFGVDREMDLLLHVMGLPIGFDTYSTHSKSGSDVIAIIPINNMGAYGSISRTNESDSTITTLPPKCRFSQIHLSLTHRDGTLVDLNGFNWSCVLSLTKRNQSG